MRTGSRTIRIALLAVYIGGVTGSLCDDTAGAATLCVNTTGSGGCYSTIGAAVSAASSGDVVQIEAGDYPEFVSIDGKRLTLQGAGAGSTTISDGVELQYARVTIADLTLLDAPVCLSTFRSRLQLLRAAVRDCPEGVFAADSRMTASDSTFDNTVIRGAAGRVKLFRSTITNSPSNAIWVNQYSRFLIDTCTVSGNVIGINADHFLPGEVRIRRSTIAANGDGVTCPSGLVLWHNGFEGVRASLDSTIIADNIGPCASPDLGNTGGGTTAFIISRGFNLVENGNASLIRSKTTDLFGADPMLGPLQDNGGPTETHALLPGSPAIGAVDSRCGFADQRGVTRLPPPCDAGAVEFP